MHKTDNPYYPYEIIVIAETEDADGFTVALCKYPSVAEFILEELKEMTDEEIEDISP